MADIQFSSVIPVLPSIDIEASVNFYRNKLGFSLAFQYPEYAGVEAGPVQIHFWHCEDPEIPRRRVAGSICWVSTLSIKRRFSREWSIRMDRLRTNRGAFASSQ
jgi:catechol 2,3-dioxygenase-like lactoylglutathione lyase family enzyme